MKLITIVVMLLSLHGSAWSQQIETNKTPVTTKTVVDSTNNIHIVDSLKSATSKKPVEGKHQLSLFGGGGVATFLYQPNYGARLSGNGFTLGMDYSYYWNKKWGVTSGLTLDSYNSSLDMSGVNAVSMPSDADFDYDGIPDVFELTSQFNGLVSKQHALLLSVPIELRFRQPFSPKCGFWIGAGPKFSAGIVNSAQVVEGSFTTSGYFPADGLTLKDKPHSGFTTYSPRTSVNSDLGFGISILSDLDFYFRINQIFTVYAGPYFEYQLNKTKGGEVLPPVKYTSVFSEGITTAESTYDPSLNAVAPDGARRLAYGVKFGLIFDIGGYKQYRNDRKDELLAAELLRLAELQRKATADSLANVLLALQLRQKAVADSISNAEKMAENNRRLAELALLEKQRLNDSIANAKAQNVTVIMDVRTKTLSPDELELLKLPIIFKFGSADISGQSSVNAQKIGAMLARHPDLLLRITGHTCDIGSEQVNYKLGLRRAQTLFREFTQSGVLPQNVTTLSKGELEPVTPNIDEPNRQRNRRVVVVIEDDENKSTDEKVYH